MSTIIRNITRLDEKTGAVTNPQPEKESELTTFFEKQEEILERIEDLDQKETRIEKKLDKILSLLGKNGKNETKGVDMSRIKQIKERMSSDSLNAATIIQQLDAFQNNTGKGTRLQRPSYFSKLLFYSCLLFFSLLLFQLLSNFFPSKSHQARSRSHKKSR